MTSRTTANVWNQRVQRAGELAKSYPAAEEILKFYIKVAEFQKSVYLQLESSAYMNTEEADRLPEKWDEFALLPWFRPLLSVTAQFGPTSLAHLASELAEAGPARWQQLITAFWDIRINCNGDSSPASFFAHAFLQPYAEYLARRATGPRTSHAEALCPFCSSKPMLGILRPEGDGGKRSLLCSLCGTERDFRRIFCPACGEEDVKQLPIYTAAGFDYLRVEACETCKNFIKTIDLTKNGHAIPIVDELASIPLTLWAVEKGYTKLQGNLLGT